MKENLKRKDYSGMGVDAYCTKIFTVPRGKRFALCYTSFFDHFAIEYLTNVFLRKNVRTLGLREICQLWTTLQQNIWTNQAAQIKTHYNIPQPNEERRQVDEGLAYVLGFWNRTSAEDINPAQRILRLAEGGWAWTPRTWNN